MAYEPDHQQSQAGNSQADHGHAKRVGLALAVQVALQLLQVGHHGVQRQLQHQGPAGVGLADAER
ncbi:hypothetical protein D3C71_2070170 [compost metagenome]